MHSIPLCVRIILQALEADVSRWQSEIPADQAAAESLGQQLAAAEAKLEALQDSIKGEVEGYHQQMSKVGLSSWCSQVCSWWIAMSETPPADKQGKGGSWVIRFRV
jgi:Zn-dependent protease with chaperone function